jgi:hypothetical protein
MNKSRIVSVFSPTTVREFIVCGVHVNLRCSELPHARTKLLTAVQTFSAVCWRQ